MLDMKVRAQGDLHIDFHHTTEDTSIVIGQAIAKALGDFKGIRRFGEATIPMDETLTRCTLDVSNRPYLIWKVNFTRPKLGEMDTELFKEWFQAVAQNAGITWKISTARTTTISSAASRRSPGRSAARSNPTSASATPTPRRAFSNSTVMPAQAHPATGRRAWL